MKKADKKRMYLNIEKHGKNLNAIFNTGIEPVTLCKKLFRLENKAHRLATEYCNGDIDIQEWEKACDSIYSSLEKILKQDEKEIDIFINGDCRGYALKINDTWLRDNGFYYEIYQDWGGYGIIAPDFTPEKEYDYKHKYDGE